MLYNYLKIGLRNLLRQRGFTVLNVMGLALGIASVLLIYRMVTYELSFNKDFANSDRIVRVVTTEVGADGEKFYTRGMPLSAMNVVKTTVPQFVYTAKIKEAWPTVIVPNMTGGAALKKFNMGQNNVGLFVEPEFCQIFDFQWIAGDKNNTLKAPNTVVLSKEMAGKCFDSSEKAMGQTLLIDNEPMVVEGIIQTPPINCHFPVQVFISYATILSDKKKYEYNEDWGNTSSNDQLFGLLQNADAMAAANTLVAEVGKVEYAMSGGGQIQSKSHHLQPLSELHYDDRFGTFATPVVSKNRLWILSFIGILILAMACFNFINLSTAMAMRRAKEIGVRKSLGGSRAILFGQFMSETALVVLFSVVLGAFIAGVTAPLLQYISDVPADLPFLGQVNILLFLAGLAVVMTVFSGFYPSLVLAGFNPVRALKNDVSNGSMGGVSLRKGLVVLQFTIAQVLIVGTIITLSQMNYLQNMDLGFKKDLIYTFGISGDSLSQSKMDGFKQQLLQIPGVESAAFGNDQPSSGSTWSTNFAIGRGSEDQKFNTSIKFCDADYQKTYGLELVAGRWLEPSDTSKEYIVNMTLLKKSGITNPEEALQMEVRLGRNQWRKVVGVVKDFHSHSAHNELEPIVISCSKKRFYTAGVEIEPKNMVATTAAIQRAFDNTYPEQVFDATYFDESIANFYTSENRFSDTCKGFAFLAIVISCLGLFGLATHAAQQRKKEIGVRKVLGASVASVIGLLAKDFLKLVLVAIVFSVPIAWYGMKNWLSEFVYRIDMEWWMFAAAGLSAMAIAFMTVSFQSIKAAMMNPVQSLRSE